MRRYRINWHMEETYEDKDGQWVRFEDAQSELAALREDLSIFIKAQLGVSIAEPGESFVQTSLRLLRMSKRRAAEFGIPECENLEKDIEVFSENDELQQHLAAADQRSADLIELLKKISKTWNTPDPTDDDRACWDAIDDALNPKHK